MSGMKRPASTSSGNVAKKAKIATITGAISDATDTLPKDLRGLLNSTLPFALNEFKDARHNYHHEVIKMATGALGEIENSLTATMTAAKSTSAELLNVHAEKGKRDALKNAAAQEVEGLEGVLKAKKEAAAAASESLKTAQQSLKVAKTAASKAQTAAQESTDQKTQAASAVEEDSLRAVKEGSDEAATKKVVKLMTTLATKYAFDAGMVKNFPLVCKKAADKRTEFENYTISQMVTALGNLLEVLTAGEASAISQKAEKAEALQQAETVLSDAKAALAVADNEVLEATKALKDGKKKLEGACANVEAYWKDSKQACDVADSCEKKLESFKSLLSEFVTMSDAETPAPEPEMPEEEEEEVAEEEPAPAPVAEVAEDPYATA